MGDAVKDMLVGDQDISHTDFYLGNGVRDYHENFIKFQTDYFRFL